TPSGTRSSSPTSSRCSTATRPPPSTAPGSSPVCRPGSTPPTGRSSSTEGSSDERRRRPAGRPPRTRRAPCRDPPRSRPRTPHRHHEQPAPPRAALGGGLHRARGDRLRAVRGAALHVLALRRIHQLERAQRPHLHRPGELPPEDRKSTRLNSSHVSISYAVFCLKKKNKIQR